MIKTFCAQALLTFTDTPNPLHHILSIIFILHRQVVIFMSCTLLIIHISLFYSELLYNIHGNAIKQNIKMFFFYHMMWFTKMLVIWSQGPFWRGDWLLPRARLIWKTERWRWDVNNGNLLFSQFMFFPNLRNKIIISLLTYVSTFFSFSHLHCRTCHVLI